jgi:hypothetical protein
MCSLVTRFAVDLREQVGYYPCMVTETASSG